MSQETDVSVIRSRRRRLTRQRRSIWKVLVDQANEHVTVDDVAEAVCSRDSGLHRATIYRTLAVLVEEGLLLRTDLGSGRAYYELASDHAHHHVVCSECGSVAHVHDGALASLRSQLEQASGFRLSDSELTFSGLCSTCPDRIQTAAR